MKKIFYLASIAALAFSSCAKDETTEANLGTVGGSKIVAAMEADDTRTQLDANGTYKWSAGDQLGVYGIGAHTLNNAAFVLDNSAAGSAVGVFASQATALEAGKPYLAVYPRLQKSIISEVNQEYVDDPTTSYNDYIKKVKASDVKVEILDVQKYQNGSFYTNTAPAISSKFTVTETSASVEMQPVVDYLFVNIKSTEAIETLELQLRNGDDNSYYTLAGQSTLEGYWYGNEYRYKAGEPSGDIKKIKLETDESYKSIVCHEPNTYVFVVPAGILGMGNNVEALLSVNGKTDDKYMLNAVKSTNTALQNPALAGNYRVGNFDLNYRWVDANGNGAAEDSEIHTRNKTSNNLLVYRQENTVFWMNPVDPYTGKRTSFFFNPNDDVIIENEGQLLKYLYDYAAGETTADAIICNEHEFDFSEAHMKVISSEMTKTTSKYYPYQAYINKYYMGEFPTIGEYKANFNGAGAVIEGIEYALDNERGIFGKITGKIENVTFDGVKTADVEIVKDQLYTKGLVLGTLGTNGSIDNVTVKNANAFAILGAANSAAWDELTVEGVSNLNYVVANMTISKGLDLTEDWATLKGVKNSVFGTLMAANNNDDYHHVVKLPADADYADLSFNVGVETALSFDITDQLVLNTVGLGQRSAAVTNDNKVVSVLVGETSVWTGDKFTKSDSQYMDGGAVAPAKFTKDTDVVNGWAVNGYYKVEYAEQAATGGVPETNAVLMRNLDLSKAVNEWAQVEYNHLEGNGKTVNGVKMTITGVSEFTGSSVAPMTANKLTNIVINDIKLNIVTESATYVPQTIGGVVNLTGVNPLVENVKVNGLTITGEGVGANNEQYVDEYPAYIGWLVGKATDATIEDSQVLNVKNEIIGIAGLVGWMTLNSTANIENSSATVTSMVQTSLANFKNYGKVGSKYAESNFAGTAVGMVIADNSISEAIVKFENVGKPVFAYNAKSAKIKVLYDAGEADVILTQTGATGNYAW